MEELGIRLQREVAICDVHEAWVCRVHLLSADPLEARLVGPAAGAELRRAVFTRDVVPAAVTGVVLRSTMSAGGQVDHHTIVGYRTRWKHTAV